MPIVAYDIPVCVHTKLARKTVVQLAGEGAIVGLKDSSGDDGNFRYALLDLAATPDVFLMTGSEIVVDNALMMGAHGVVPGLANVDPKGYVRLWDAAQRGDWAAAREEQERLCRLFEIVWVAAGRVSGGCHRRRRLQDRHAQPRRDRHQRHGPPAARRSTTARPAASTPSSAPSGS